MEEKHALESNLEKDRHVVQTTYIKPQARKLHDPDVTFEEYYYYACKTRAEEKNLSEPKIQWRELMLRKKAAREDTNGTPGGDPAKEHTEVIYSKMEDRINICKFGREGERRYLGC